MPSKLKMGVFKYNDKYCVFTDLESIEKFISDPKKYLDEVIEKCRLMPELIDLLKCKITFLLPLWLRYFKAETEASTFLYLSPIMVDKGIVTPTHFIEKHIEPNYVWNDWELRRKALQMANFRRKVTVSTQTELSNFRSDN